MTIEFPLRLRDFQPEAGCRYRPHRVRDQPRWAVARRFDRWRAGKRAPLMIDLKQLEDRRSGTASRSPTYRFRFEHTGRADAYDIELAFVVNEGEGSPRSATAAVRRSPHLGSTPVRWRGSRHPSAQRCLSTQARNSPGPTSVRVGQSRGHRFPGRTASRTLAASHHRRRRCGGHALLRPR